MKNVEPIPVVSIKVFVSPQRLGLANKLFGFLERRGVVKGYPILRIERHPDGDGGEVITLFVQTTEKNGEEIYKALQKRMAELEHLQENLQILGQGSVQENVKDPLEGVVEWVE